MKIFRLLSLLAMMSFAACANYLPQGTAIPSAPAIVAIDIVLPGAPMFSFGDQRKIEPLISFLRQECHWTAVDGGREESKDMKALGYQIIIRRIDGSQEAIDVTQKEAIKAGYHSRLSTSASERLDELCGVDTVHLSPFGRKKPNQTPEPTAPSGRGSS